MIEKKISPTWINVKEALSTISREELISIINDLYKLRKENKRLLLGRYGLTATSLDNYTQSIPSALSRDDYKLNTPFSPSQDDNEPNITPAPAPDDNELNVTPALSLDENEINISPAPSLDDDKLNISPEPSQDDSKAIIPSDPSPDEYQPDARLDNYKLKITSAINPKLARKISFKGARQAVSDYKKASGDQEGVAELMVFYCEECAGTIKRVGVWEQYAAGTINIWLDTLTYIQQLPPQQHTRFWKKLDAAQKLMGQVGWGVSDMLDIYMFKYSPYAEGDEDLP
ncbi:MAG: hypothetical protein LHW56_08990 [Candidatus Cloacimonetes bacterium]|nr:hypothetical protein [Candidatus Cloacimonadota bacterium]MDY0173029.1 hypothetical protein [Candidatus Cloacimonadaceae bacterium]